MGLEMYFKLFIVVRRLGAEHRCWKDHGSLDYEGTHPDRIYIVTGIFLASFLMGTNLLIGASQMNNVGNAL